MDARGNRSLVLELDKGESLQVTLPAASTDQVVSLTVLDKSGKRARLRVVAAPAVRVQRTAKEEFPAPT